ncbi:TPA: S-type pyocin domain-containing protein, partial [Enterobacter kobei]
MAVKGYYLFRGDKTRCGGVITEGWSDHQHFGRDMSCEGHKVTCGKHPGIYRICGGLDDDIHGKRIAGTLHSYSSCPCKSKFINSNWDDDYELGGEATITHTDLSHLVKMPVLPEPIGQAQGVDAKQSNQEREYSRVFAKSCLRGEGCTDAGTEQELLDNFGQAGYYRAAPQTEQEKEEPVQHSQAAKKHKPAEPTPPPKDNRPWYKRLFSSSDTTKAAAAAGMATARAATTTGITTGAATEAGYAALQQIGGTLSTAGRWIAPSPPTVLLFGMFYSPKLNSGEQDYIDKMRLEQAAQNKEDIPTRVRFRWEADQNGMISPKGFHVSGRGGQDKVPVRMLQKNTTTGNYEFWEDGADKPTIVWTPADPGYSSPSNTGNQDNVYIPPNVLVYPESEINSPWSTVIPAPGEHPFRDYILVHPLGTFDPIYIYLNADHKYHVAPRGTPPLPAFPDAKMAKKRTPVKGGGTLRSRWKDSKGRIFEWDSQHGTVEMYDRSGRNHLGEFDPVSGE